MTFKKPRQMQLVLSIREKMPTENRSMQGELNSLKNSRRHNGRAKGTAETQTERFREGARHLSGKHLRNGRISWYKAEVTGISMHHDNKLKTEYTVVYDAEPDETWMFPLLNASKNWKMFPVQLSGLACWSLCTKTMDLFLCVSIVE